MQGFNAGKSPEMQGFECGQSLNFSLPAACQEKKNDPRFESAPQLKCRKKACQSVAPKLIAKDVKGPENCSNSKHVSFTYVLRYNLTLLF